MNSQKEKSGGCEGLEGGGNGELLSKCRVAFSQDAEFWRLVAPQCEYAGLPGTVHLKMVTVINLMLFLFCHSFKKKKNHLYILV